MKIFFPGIIFMKFFGARLFMVAGMLKTNKTITLFDLNNQSKSCVLLFAENCAGILPISVQSYFLVTAKP